MKKSLIYIVVAAILIGLAGYKIVKNKEERQATVAEVAKQVDQINVNIEEVKYDHVNTEYTVNGTFLPKAETNISSEIAGKVIDVRVKEGAKVNAGQIVAVIKKDAIEVDMTQAQNNLQNAIIDNQRYENAYKTGGVTKQQLDNSRLQLKNARAAVQAQSVRVNNAYVRAGISGTVNKRMVEPGAIVSPGTPMLEIVNINTLKLSVLVDESQVGRIRLGQQVNITVGSLGDEVISGRVSFIAPKSDTSLNFPVEIEVANNGRLKAGMYGTVVFKSENGGAEQSMLTIPAEAFVNGVSSGQVFVAENGIAKLKTVTVGKVYGNRVQIVDGLKVGEKVITSGQINLDNGSKINIIK